MRRVGWHPVPVLFSTGCFLSGLTAGSPVLLQRRSIICAKGGRAEIFTVCSYCHRVTGEHEPFHSYLLSHVICPACLTTADINSEIPFVEESVDFFRRLSGSAMQGDYSSCESLLNEGLELGLRSSDLMITALSGVLNDVGNKWEAGEITDADERRVTKWCVAFLNQLPALENPRYELDIVGIPADKNTHNVGSKIAEYIARERGFSIEILPKKLDVESLFQFLEARSAKHLVISCALPTMISSSLQTASELKRKGYAGEVLLTGAAVRRAPELSKSFAVSCASTIWEILLIVSQKKREHSV